MSTVQTEKYYVEKMTICVGDRTNLLTISSSLFKDLRKFDDLGIDIILAESVDEQGLGKAIMNRLGKAQEKQLLYEELL